MIKWKIIVDYWPNSQIAHSQNDKKSSIFDQNAQAIAHQKDQISSIFDKKILAHQNDRKSY